MIHYFLSVYERVYIYATLFNAVACALVSGRYRAIKFLKMKTLQEWEEFLAKSQQWKDMYTPPEFTRITILSKATYRIVKHAVFKWIQTWDDTVYVNGRGNAIRLSETEDRCTRIGRKTISSLFDCVMFLLDVYNNYSTEFLNDQWFYNREMYSMIAKHCNIPVDVNCELHGLFGKQYSCTCRFYLVLHVNEYRRRAWLAWYHGDLRTIPRDVMRGIVALI